MFTTPCFIRKNTPELRKKLEELGYQVLLNYFGLPCLSTHEGMAIPAEDINRDGNIDCGENEELFLAIAALREGSCKHQWCCDDNGIWEKSESVFPSRYMQMHGHKATVEELIEHFKQ